MASTTVSTQPLASTTSIKYTPGHNAFCVLTFVLVVSVTGKTQPGPIGLESQFIVYGETPPTGATFITPSLLPLHKILVGVVNTDKAAGLPTITESVEVHPW